MRMIASRLSSRIISLVLALSVSPLALIASAFTQDISGGSSSELARATEIEGRTGKGIFSAPKTVAHHARKPEQKLVARATSPLRNTQRDTTAGGSRETSGGSSDDQSK